MTLQLYLFRQVAVALGVALGCLGLALFPPSVLSALSRLGGVGMGVILGYLPYVVIELAPYLLPMSFLLAIIAMFSRMAANGEWVAIQMSRIHPLRTALPGFLIAVVLSAASFFCLHDYFPTLRLKQEDYKRSAALKVIEDLLPGRTTIQVGAFSVAGRDRVGNRFEDVVVRLPPLGDEPGRRIVASAAELSVVDDAIQIAFLDAHTTTDTTRARSKGVFINVPLDLLLTVDRANPLRPRHMRSSAIRAGLEQGTLPEEDRLVFQYEIERRNALTACYLVFLALGIPTGLRLKTESMLGALGATALYACVYYVFSLRIGKSVVLAESLPVWIGAWAANAIGLLVALFFIFRWRRR